jgi:hypothetical protein
MASMDFSTRFSWLLGIIDSSGFLNQRRRRDKVPGQELSGFRE